jgi:RES domain-containing protein
MLVWRLSPPALARALDGAGNRIVGARWNSPGHGVVYTCVHLSLCVLETHVHFPASQRLSLPQFEAVRLDVPDNAGISEISLLEWSDLLSTADHEGACRSRGDQWLMEFRDLVLIAPSVVVPEDHNVMLNPEHPRMRDVSIVSTRRFNFDPRLLTAHS